MAKKNPFETEDQTNEVTPQSYADDIAGMDMTNGLDGGINFETDFNLEEEYKESPLCPQGNYFGITSGVSWNGETQALEWEVTLDDSNEGVMSDGDTPLAGQTFGYTNWFPKKGDENERTKKGRMTKRQAKINMITDFAKKMQIAMNSPKAIIDAVQNGDWVGIPVVVSISIGQYKGRFNNRIDEMVRRPD